jgi:hypothetical protein
MAEGFSRRRFIIGTGLTAAALVGRTDISSAADRDGVPAAAGDAVPGGPSPYHALKYYYPVPSRPREVHKADIVIYGGTSAGATAAVQASRLGMSVILAVFGRHIGGITAAGLGATDTGTTAAIGGISREFYQRVGAHYGQPTTFHFEPHVAETVYEDWIAEHDISVYREQRLKSVRMSDGRIVETRMESGMVFQARVFVDATYEGDLMAAAGVSYAIGREPNATYDETVNGVQFGTGHQFRVPVDPYVVPGDPGSGLLSGISADAPGTTGQGDRSVQAYNFRLCLTRAADRIPFPRPPGYEPGRYELLLRYIQAGVWDVFGNNQAMPDGKTDMNNNGAVATDDIGRNYGWPDGKYEERERIFQDHVRYQQGMLYFLANDPGVPQTIRDQVSGWGLPRDEFTGTGGWPHELYVREGRRMISERVITEHDCRGLTTVEDSVGLASYTMDSHNCHRLVVDGKARNEGNVEVPVPGPYRIPYRALRPRSGECDNLLVPVALSASHIAYGSVRMEPVFMLLGQAAATAGALAVSTDIPVQDVDYLEMRRRLLQDGAIVEWPPPAGPLTLDGPALIPGEAAKISATIHNDEAAAIHDVTLALDLPAGWHAEATSPTRIEEIAAGGTAEAAWKVTASAQDEPASLPGITARAEYVRVDGASITREAQAKVPVVEPVAAPYRTFGSAAAYFGQRGGRLGIIAGGADLWTGTDQYGALYLAGAGGEHAVAVTRVISQDPTNPQARAGLMMRDNITGAGRSTGYVVLAVKPEQGFLLLWDADGNGFVESVARAQTATTPYPVWLRLERSGATYTGHYSTDGVSWTLVGQTDLSAAGATQDIGIFVTSHDTTLGRVLFDGFRVETTQT